MHVIVGQDIYKNLKYIVTVRRYGVQVSVLPLEVYNDVEQLAAPALTAQHMVGEAEADAEMCLRKLITNLAAEVFHPAHA